MIFLPHPSTFTRHLFLFRRTSFPSLGIELSFTGSKKFQPAPGNLFFLQDNHVCLCQPLFFSLLERTCLFAVSFLERYRLLYNLKALLLVHAGDVSIDGLDEIKEKRP